MDQLARRADEILLGLDLDMRQPYYFDLGDWRTHWHTVGPPGSGKTMLSFLIAIQLIRRGKPVVLLDPLGALYYLLVVWLSWQPKRIQERVVLWHPGGLGEYWPGVNTYELQDYEADIAVKATDNADIFAKAFRLPADQGILLSKNLQDFNDPIITNKLTALELDHFVPLGKSPLRQKLAAMSSDPSARDAILRLDGLPPREQGQRLLSLDDRLPRLIRPKAMKMMLGRTQNTLDVEQIVEGGKSLICFLGARRNLLHQRHAYLIGSLLFNAFARYALQRTPQQTRNRPFYVIIDEFPQIVVEGMIDALDLLRNAGMRMFLIHQRLEQLARESPDLLSAVLTDARARCVFGGLPEHDLEILGPLMTQGDLDLMSLKDSIELPSVVGYKETPVTSQSQASSWAESDGYGFGSGGGTADISSYGFPEGGGVSGGRAGYSSSSYDSDISMSSSSRGETKGVTHSTRMDPTLEWLTSSKTFWGLEELRYLAKAELYKQQPQHIIFRNMTERRRRIQVATVREYPVKIDRIQRLIETCIAAHPHFYMRESDIWLEIEERRKWLESIVNDEPEHYGDSQRARSPKDK